MSKKKLKIKDKPLKYWEDGDELPDFPEVLAPFHEYPLFVGFTTERREDYEWHQPDFVSDAVKEETRERHRQQFTETYEAEAKNTPYIGRLRLAAITGPLDRPDQVYRLMHGAPKLYKMHTDKPPNTMLLGKKFGMWSSALLQNHKVCLVGFNIRTFAKMAGYEAAEGGFAIRNPDIWFATDNVDTNSILIPRTPAFWPQIISLQTSLCRLCDVMDEKFRAKYTPGRWPGVDAALSMYIACKLHLYRTAFVAGKMTIDQAGAILKEEIAIAKDSVTIKLKKKK